MNEYTYSEARRKLARLLEQAEREGEVRIKRKDGRIFVIRPQPRRTQSRRKELRRGSPLEVEGIDLGITTPEILSLIGEGRRAD